MYAKRYQADGTPAGDEFQVNAETGSTQWRPAVAIDTWGNFVITWESSGQDGSSYGIYAQRYDADGNPVGTEFRVNTETASSQIRPSIAMDGLGDFVVTWSSNLQDGSGYGVYAQAFFADGVRKGREVLVNTFTGGSQTYSKIALDARGNFVVAWASDGQDGSGYGVYARQFLVPRVLPGPEFQVNNHSYLTQANPSVAVDGSGNFVVVWESYGQDGSGYGVYARRYYPDGSPNGDEFLVNNTTSGDQRHPAVAMNVATGAFVIAWSRYSLDGKTQDIYAKRYRPDGTPEIREFPDHSQEEEGEFLVNSYTAGIQTSPAVAVEASGRFAVAWESLVQDGSEFGIYAQRYNADGSRSGAEFRVNAYTTSSQTSPAVAFDDVGRMIVAWDSYQDGSATGIYARRYDPDGNPIGAVFRVNTETASYQAEPSVAMDGEGNTVVAWQSYLQDGYDYGIYAQLYRPDGTRNGSEFRVNDTTTGNESHPRVAINASTGAFVVTWDSNGQTGSNYFNVYARSYRPDGTPEVEGEFLVNTYTDNSQSYPAVAMDPVGNFVVAWEDHDRDGSFDGVFARQFVTLSASHDHQRSIGVVETVRNVDFGNYAVGAVLRGQVFEDLNGDRQRDGEAALAPWTIFHDINGNGFLDFDEPHQETDLQGNYEWVVAPGDYILSQQRDEWEQTTPTKKEEVLAAVCGNDGLDCAGQWWRLSTQRGVSLPSFYFGAEQGRRYPSRGDQEDLGKLTADVDLTQHTGTIQLEFQHFLQVHEDDIARVSVVANGVSEVVADNQQVGGLEATTTTEGFQTVQLDLSKYAGELIKIEFTVEPTVDAPRTDRLSYAVTANQKYYVKIDGLEGSTHPMYDLAIAGTGVPVDRNDVLGPNDDLTHATALVVDQTEKHLSIQSGDQDWYKLSVPPSVNVHAYLFFRQDLGDLDFYMYDDLGNEIASSLSSTDNEAISIRSPGATTDYFFQVIGRDAATNPDYDLVVFAHDIQDNPNDADVEPNDNADQATNLGSVLDLTLEDLIIHETEITVRVQGGTVIETIGNADFYEFVADPTFPTETIPYRIHLLFRHDLGDLRLFLYDQNGSVLAQSQSGDDNESVFASLSRGKTYYIAVKGQPQYAYDLVIDGGEIQQDGFDVSGGNNDFDSAASLGSLGDGSTNDRLGYRRETNLTVDSAIDADYYSFVTQAAGTVHIDLRFDQHQGDIDVFLYDSQRELVASLEGWYIDVLKVASLGRYDVHAVLGEEKAGLDFGVRQESEFFGTGDGGTGSISGWVFEDKNENQYWDEGEEEGMGGVKVWLFVDEDNNGVNEYETFTYTGTGTEPPGDGVPLGYYSFAGLYAKTLEKPYRVRLDRWETEQTYPLENNFQDKYAVTVGDQTSSTSPDPQSVAVGNFNNDGLIDLATLDHQTGDLLIWLNSGTPEAPVFQQLQTRSLAYSGPVAVISADFDGLYGDDLAVVSQWSGGATDFNGRVRVFLNTGNGFNSQPNQVLSVGMGPQSVAVGDFDGQPGVDLIVANDLSGSLSLLVNNGQGTFTSPKPPVTAGVGTFAVASGDFYGDDGHLDLVVANIGDLDYSGGSVVILKNDGTGGFTKQPAVVPWTNQAPCDVAAGDFDGNGLTDFAVAYHERKSVSIFWNRSADPKLPDFHEQQVLIGSGPTSLISVDMDGDEDFDLVVTAGLVGADASRVKVLRNIGGQMELEEPPGGVLQGEAVWPQIYAFSATDASRLYDESDTNGPALAVVHSSQVLLLKNRIQGGSHKLALAADTSLMDVNLGMKSPPPLIESVKVNGGVPQRSKVENLVIEFNGLVTVEQGAFQVVRRGTWEEVSVAFTIEDIGDKTFATVTFSGQLTQFGSLIEGNYQLTVRGNLVHDRFSGRDVDGDDDGLPGGDYLFGEVELDAFFRYFGDADGDRDVDLTDFAHFRRTYNKGASEPSFNPAFDYDSNGVVNLADFAFFRRNFGKRLSF